MCSSLSAHISVLSITKSEMWYLSYLYKTALKLAVNIGYIVKLGVDSQLLRLHRYACQDAGIVLYQRGMGCSYCELFSGFGPPAPIGEKQKKRSVAGDGPGGCRETVQGEGGIRTVPQGKLFILWPFRGGGFGPKIKKIYHKRTGFFFHLKFFLRNNEQMYRHRAKVIIGHILFFTK